MNKVLSSFSTKREAIKFARDQRAAGKVVKVFKIEQPYTIPGRGFHGLSVTFEVRSDA